MSIAQAVQDLSDALAELGVERPVPPTAPPPFDEIEAAIAPLSLPVELREFWSQLNPYSIRVWPFPEFIGPADALRHWLSGQATFPDMYPMNLFPVAYAAQTYLFVELDDPAAGPGGALFEFGIVDGAPDLMYASLVGWLQWITGEVRAGRHFTHDDLGDPARTLHLDREAPDARAGHPRYGTSPRIGRMPGEWPEHWQRASGFGGIDPEPRGATLSIADLLLVEPDESKRHVIHGTVDTLAGIGGCVAAVSDGTGSVVVHCPPTSMPFGLQIGGSFELEVKVSAEPVAGRHDGRSSDYAPVLREADRVHAHGSASVTATSVRPLDS